MSDGRPESGLAGMGVDEDALEVRRVRAEARRRLFGDRSSVTRIGRYELLRMLGSGAMGTVYSARDPDLDRTVALKLLHPARDLASADLGSRRLLREARALAQIDDRRVATILDVGSSDGRVYLAMEVIEGTDLAAWLAGAPDWEEVLDAFVEAGLGLAAAHDAGVVHRDFKPHNVLRTPTGRVVVVDFGLATAARGHTDAVEGSDQPLTEAGRPLGTPAFMAPEQEHGEADARSDQYAFCVALRDATDSRGTPASIRWRLRTVIDRGLQASPDDRWPDMHALLDALARARRSRRQGSLLAGATAAAAVAAWLVWPEPAPVTICGWTPPPRDTTLLLDTTADRNLSEYADRLVRAYDTACRLETPSLACLERVRLEYEVLVDSLPTLPARRLHTAIADLRPPSDCAEGPSRASDPREEPFQRRLAEATTLQRAGEFDAADRAAAEVVKEAMELGLVGPQADAFLLRSGLAHDRAQDGPAATFAEQAVFAAIDLDDDRRLADAALQLAVVHTRHRDRPDEAHRWSRISRTAAERIGMPSDLSVDLIQLEGAIAFSQGDYATARDFFERALAEGMRLYGADHYDLAPILNNIGAVSYSTSDYARARAAWLAAARIYERTLGEDHPDVATALSNLAIALMAQRDYEMAIQTHRRALSIRHQALGADSPKLADSHHNLGIVLDLAGRRDEARREHATALSLREGAYGSNHPAVAPSHAALGNLAIREQRLEDARRHHQRAVDLWTGSLGAEHPDVLRSQARVAEADLGMGNLAAALAGIDRVLEAWLPSLGPIHQDVLAGRTMRATCLLELGRADEARHDLDQALVEIARADVEHDPRALADLKFVLIRALYRDPSQRRRAIALAEELRDSLASVPNDEPIALREEVETWLQTPARD